jgi:hypothetical protein
MSKSDDGDRSVSFSFSIGPGDDLREVHDDSVAALDDALQSTATGGVNHFFDPQRLLVHDIDPKQTASVVFEPADELAFSNDGDTLVVGIPADHPQFDTFGQVGDEPSVRWTFR